MPPKRRFRPPPQVLRNNGKMCEPAMLYLVISVLGLIMIVMQNTSSDVYCMGTYECERVSKPTAFIIQVFYIAFWTWLLNTLCKNGYKNISWIIVLFPFLLYAAAVFGLASSGVFHVREGADLRQDPIARQIAVAEGKLTLNQADLGDDANNHIDIVVGTTGNHQDTDPWKKIRVPRNDWAQDNDNNYEFGTCSKEWASAPGGSAHVQASAGGKLHNGKSLGCWVPDKYFSDDGKINYTRIHKGDHNQFKN